MIKDVKGTVILFSSGSFRVMGCADAIKAAFLLYSCLEKIDDDDIPELYCQSYTSRTKLSRKINLSKLCECDDTFYEPELFAAVRMIKYNPVSVNVFSTGAIVACGLKEPEDFYPIINDIDALCKSINM